MSKLGLAKKMIVVKIKNLKGGGLRVTHLILYNKFQLKVTASIVPIHKALTVLISNSPRNFNLLSMHSFKFR